MVGVVPVKGDELRIALLGHGSYVLVRRRAMVLRDLGVDCVVFTAHPSEDIGAWQRVVQVPFQRAGFRYAAAVPGLMAELRRFRPDVIDGHGATTYGAIGAYLPNGSSRLRVCTAYGTDVYTHAAKSVVARTVARKTLSRVDLIYASSSSIVCYAQGDLGINVRPKLVAFSWGMPVIDNGGENRKAIARSFQVTRSQIGASAEALVALHPRKLSTHWRVPWLIGILDTVASDIDRPVELWLVYSEPKAGDAPVLAALEEAAAKCSHLKVRFLGPRSNKDLISLYAAADLFLCAAPKEMLATSVLEAMHYGAIPVLSAIPPFEELAAWSPSGVVLAEPYDRDRWVSEILRLSSEDEGRLRQMAEANYQAIRKNGDDRVCAARFRDVLSQRLAILAPT